MREIQKKTQTIIIENDCLLCQQQEHVMNSCPMESIKPGAPYPYIDDTCVNCGICIAECPHNAIVETEVQA